MITAIEIENFKCIGNRIRIELAPITLLFGPNSAGKSTALEALIYAHEVLNRNNPDAGDSLKGGTVVNFGGYQNAVHQHDRSNRISIRLEFSRRDTECESNPVPVILFDSFDPLHSAGLPPQGWVEVEVSSRAGSSGALVTRFEVGFNNRMIGALTASRDAKNVWLTELDLRHLRHLTFLLNHDDLVDRLSGGGVIKTDDGREIEVLPRELESIDSLAKWQAMAEGGPLTLLQSDFETVVTDTDFEDGLPLAVNPTCVLPDGGLQLPVADSRSALPEAGRALRLEEAWREEEPAPGGDFEAGPGVYWTWLLSKFFVGALGMAKAELEPLVFLGPLRECPPREYRPPRRFEPARWATGLAGWDVLSADDGDLAAAVSDWVRRDDRLNTGYDFRKVTNRRLDESHPLAQALLDEAVLDTDNLRRLYQSLPIDHQLVLIEQATSLEVLPADVGTGISQVLPVVVASLAPNLGLVCLEQPELHIHPAMQVRLGDLFASAIRDVQGRQFVIETHSEHLLLRLLRRVRETNANELPPGSPTLLARDLGVVYFQHSNSGTHVRSLCVSDEGDFEDQWPDGFFEERTAELF